MSIFAAWANDPNGSSAVVANQTTYCPGLRVAGSLVAAITLPRNGYGYLAVRSVLNMVLQNNGTSLAKVCFGIGVTNPSQDSKPMYPYLGVSHNRCDSAYSFITIHPGDAVPIAMDRLDIVDINLVPGIPGWPNWTMDKAPNGFYPQIVASAGVLSGSGVIAKDVRLIAHSL